MAPRQAPKATARPTTTVTAGGSGVEPPPITVSSADTIEMHTIGDWEIEEFLDASRGKLSEVVYLFYGGCLGSAATTAKYIVDYLKSPTETLGKAALIQCALFVACLALGIAFHFITKKSTNKAAELAAKIRKRAKITFVRSP